MTELNEFVTQNQFQSTSIKIFGGASEDMKLDWSVHQLVSRKCKMIRILHYYQDKNTALVIVRAWLNSVLFLLRTLRSIYYAPA